MARGDEEKLLVMPAKELLGKSGWKIESWAASGGHQADFLAKSPNGRRVVVEAKDYRKDEAGIDFWTVIGQVVVNMDGSDQDYAILIPSAGLPWFRRHLSAYSRKLLKLRVFVMDGGQLSEADANWNLVSLNP
jgi:hypothetical protein